ncbi:hypothetical protein HT031_006785 [Scenedesmus sp. PABB004]|nr:hypothetical protein HT031_006785 [Scenedesmus sp. PABB004]
MNEAPGLETESSADSFKDLIASAFCGLADAPPDGAGGADGAPEPLELKADRGEPAAGDTAARRDVERSGSQTTPPGHASHPSSAGGSDPALTAADAAAASGRGRGRGRARRRGPGQQETAQQRAHRRFYERKKAKMAALEQEAADKLAQYQALARENAELRRRYDALTCTIAGSDEQMTLLQAMGSLALGEPGGAPRGRAGSSAPAAGGAAEPSPPHAEEPLGDMMALLLGDGGRQPGAPHPQPAARGLHRSASLPVRASAPGSGSPPLPGGALAAAAAAARAHSSSPNAWQGGVAAAFGQPGALAAQRPYASDAGGPPAWRAAPSRLQQAAAAAPAALDAPHGHVARPHSWSGPEHGPEGGVAAPGLHRASASFPSATSPSGQLQLPELTPQPPYQQAPAAHEAGAPAPGAVAGWQPQQLGAAGPQPAGRPGQTVTTGGPTPAQLLLQQQRRFQRSDSDPTARFSGGQAAARLLQQQQQERQRSLPCPTGGAFAGPPPAQLLALRPLEGAPPALAPPAQLLPVKPELELDLGGLPPELAMLDDELMLLLDRTLDATTPRELPLLSPGLPDEAGSGGLLSPLPSFPSAGADLAAVGGLPPPAQPAGAAPAGPANLLEASRALQARHEAAGFRPPAGPADFSYLHDMVAWYRSRIAALAELLPAVDRALPDVGAGVALVQVVEELVMGLRKFGTRNRVGIWEAQLINLETGAFDEAPPSHWRAVFASIGFTPPVREQLAGCYALYRTHVARVADERAALLAELAGLQARLDGGGGAARGARRCPATLQFRDDGAEDYAALLDRLGASVAAEHAVANMLMYSCAQVASHTQMAKAMLHSWPYMPNGTAMLGLMYADDAAAAAAAEAARRGGAPGAWGGAAEALGRMRSA